MKAEKSVFGKEPVPSAESAHVTSQRLLHLIAVRYRNGGGSFIRCPSQRLPAETLGAAVHPKSSVVGPWPDADGDDGQKPDNAPRLKL